MLGPQLLQALRAAGGRDHPRSLGEEGVDARAADAARCAGDQHYRARGHGSPRATWGRGGWSGRVQCVPTGGGAAAGAPGAGGRRCPGRSGPASRGRRRATSTMCACMARAAASASAGGDQLGHLAGARSRPGGRWSRPAGRRTSGCGGRAARRTPAGCGCGRTPAPWRWKRAVCAPICPGEALGRRSSSASSQMRSSAAASSGVHRCAASRAADRSTSSRASKNSSTCSDRGLVDEGAVAGPERDPAVAVQPLQRLAHRAAAHPELGGEPFLHEVVTGCKGPADQHLLQPLVDQFAEGKGPDGLFVRHRQ